MKLLLKRNIQTRNYPDCALGIKSATWTINKNPSNSFRMHTLGFISFVAIAICLLCGCFGITAFARGDNFRADKCKLVVWIEIEIETPFGPKNIARWMATVKHKEQTIFTRTLLNVFIYEWNVNLIHAEIVGFTRINRHRPLAGKYVWLLVLMHECIHGHWTTLSNNNVNIFRQTEYL